MTEAIKVHLPQALRREIEAAAEAEQRSLSGLLRVVISQWAKDRRRHQESAAA